MDILGPATHAAQRLVSLYRRTGADVPFGDPLPSHGTEMEGWFWRLSDPSDGRVVVALCSANQHPAGDWSTAAIALHPGGVVRSAAIDDVSADRTQFSVSARAGTDFVEANAKRLAMAIGDSAVDLTITREFRWPKAFGGGGVASSVPFLNQYWHPYRLDAKASGTVTCEDQHWRFTDATLYCERNWGAGFPRRWWWGQAHDFGEADVSVAFPGGLLEFGPLRQEVTGVVVRLQDRVLRITPPAWVSSRCDGQRWRVDARSARYRVELDGCGDDAGPHVLPVPLPAQRRNIDADYEYLAGTLRCTVREWGRVIFDGTTQLAGLEIGSRPA
ncbi:tocopherol cyclase family protein [Mycobacterium kyorinense]|uniref:tocopherol cyclase family protein n=1 Tax=Mycobacterium kyorinense TaxID=487514 RepID=UPI001E3BB05C|nr:tocopherol cyclase family protein [Mycobacterium kyorinense]